MLHRFRRKVGALVDRVNFDDASQVIRSPETEMVV